MSSQPQRVALVTGTSSGIGQVVAGKLLAAGFLVFGTSRRASLGAVEGGVVLLPLDVTDDESVQRAIDEVLVRAGRLDVLVNNAGFGVAGGAEESSIDQARAVFDTNVFGVIRMTRAVLPQMRAQGSGRIINISSVLGFIPGPFQALYSASKHAVEGYSESLDHEVRGLGIRVSLIEPAFINTPFDQNMTPPDAALDVYAEARRTAEKMRSAVAGDDPAVVADAVLAAATDSTPQRRYPAGKQAKRVAQLRRFAPKSLFDSGVRKENHLTARS